MLNRIRHAQSKYNELFAVIKLIGLSVLLSGGISWIGLIGTARAEETILLQYRARTARVPLSDLQAFVETGEASSPLQAFFQGIPLDAEETRDTLSTRIYDGRIPISSRGVEFVSIQLGAFIGDMFGRERRDDMQQALIDSFVDDQEITILEIIENYPDSTIRVNLTQLTQLHGDLTLFIERIEPILAVIEALLPELVCDCELEEQPTAGIGQPAGQSISSRFPATFYQGKHGDKTTPVCDSDTTLEKQAVEVIRALRKQANTQRSTISDLPFAVSNPEIPTRNDGAQRARFLAQSSWTPLIPLPLDGRSRLPEPIAENIIIVFGPLRHSFSIRELEQFIETGEVPSSWRFYFRVAGLDEETFRTALTEEVEVDVSLINDLLNNILGEYLLFQVGTIIHTPSGNANIQAIRAALVFSAKDDGKVSLFEFLRNYPAPAVLVEGVDLARFGANLSRRGIID
ncbi:MAG TPA: alpha/beta hydrolase, partial [Elainellaceae cyanobacterium]